MKKLILVISLAFITALAVQSCTPLQAPTFTTMSDVAISESNLNRITVTGNILMNNPNEKAIDLAEISIRMLSNGNELGTFSQSEVVPVDAKSDFKIPFTISFAPTKLGDSLMSTAMSVFSKKKLKVSFRGFVKVKGQGKKRGIKIPVIYGKTLKFK